jgi:iron complex outermembrane receptor protein
VDKKVDEPLPEIAPFEFKYRLTGNFMHQKLIPELFFRQAFKQNRIATSFGETETPAFHVIDAKISWLASKNITASGGVQNLFDVAYYEHLARSIRGADTRPVYSPGRSFYVTLTFNFL